MSGCCPADAALAVAAPAAEASSDVDLAAREIAPGVGFVQLIAPGMHCGGCVSTLERGLKALPGVRSARANLTAKRLAVEFALGETSARAVAAEADRLGFPVHPLDQAEAADEAEKRETRGLLTRLAVAGFAAMNIMLLSISVWSGAEDATRDLMHWISAAIALPTVVYCGRPFYASALAGLRAGRLNMDAPISLAVILAAALSLFETLRGGPETFFDAAVTLLFLLLVGRYLDRLMRARARSAVGTLARLQPRGATVLRGEAWTYAPLAEIAPGDHVRVAPGERIAVDGTVLEGRSDVDVSHLTGESAPEAAAPGAALRAGALNLSGALTLEATLIGEESSLAAVQRLMAEAESRKSRVARLADRAAAIYAPVVHLVALFTLIGWISAGADWRDAAFTAIAVLIITCPCALGLAAPMAQATAAGALFRRGVMLKDGAALERLALADRAVFDKTGTLTEGRPTLRAPEGAALAALPAAAALASASRHPLAAALAEHARAAGVAPKAVADARERPGLGVAARLGGEEARLGRADFVGAQDAEADAASAVWLRVGEGPALAYRFDDAPRADAADTTAALEGAGVAVEILSGDREGPVRALAARLGVAEWRAGATPEEKIAHVRRLSDAGARVLMVGDGINDAPALAAASVSMAPASAADVGRAAADLVFFGDRLAPVAEARALAVRTRRVILENFAIAAAYNAVAIPLAIAGYASPLAAAVAMSTSSILVVANALRLNATDDPATAPAAAQTTGAPAAA